MNVGMHLTALIRKPENINGNVKNVMKDFKATKS